MGDRTFRLVRIGTLEELRAKGQLVVGVSGRSVAVFWHEGRPWAVDNRCPHMGFPLSQGTVCDGLLTCHWHHARFDLASGGTLDPFAGDVRIHPLVIQGPDVFLDLGGDPDDTMQWRALTQGLEDRLPLSMAKATLALLQNGVETREIVRAAARFGSRYRASGWGPGLTILTAMANVLPLLRPDDRPLALVHGLVRVANDCAGEAPRFDLPPLPRAGVPCSRLKTWFRHAVQERDADAAERVLRTVMQSGTPPAAVADVLFAAVTDHYFLDLGHQLDYLTKAFELLDHLGWDEASMILPGLVGGLCRAQRSEEQGAWRRPVDLRALLEPALDVLATLIGDEAGGARLSRTEFDELVAVILGDAPAIAVGALLDALRRGTALTDLGQAVAHAASLRIARFPTSNEFGDWDVVHNTFSSCNALQRALRRSPSRELARGLFHAAMQIYLDRFLTVPAARLPEELPADVVSDAPAAILELLDRQQQVDAAGRLVHAHLAGGYADGPLIGTLGHAVLREDPGFHSYQELDGALSQYEALKQTYPAAATRALVALARFQAAHCPTSRTLHQTFEIAVRLQRGEELFRTTDSV